MQIFHDSVLISSDVAIGSYEYVVTFSQTPENYLNETSQMTVLLCVPVFAMLIQQTLSVLFNTNFSSTHNHNFTLSNAGIALKILQIITLCLIYKRERLV